MVFLLILYSYNLRTHCQCQVCVDALGLLFKMPQQELTFGKNSKKCDDITADLLYHCISKKNILAKTVFKHPRDSLI